MKGVDVVEDEGEVRWVVKSEADDMAVILAYISKKLLHSSKLASFTTSQLSSKHCPLLTANSSSPVTCLTALDVSGSPVGDRGIQTLGLSCMPSLRTLHLQQTGLGDEGAQFLQQTSSCLTDLTSLDVRRNPSISPTALLSLSQSLQVCWPKLLELNGLRLAEDGGDVTCCEGDVTCWDILAMEQSQLLVAFAGMRAKAAGKPVGVKLKLKGVVDCSFLTSLHALDVSSNNLRDLCWLSSLHSLRVLNISDNSITDNKSLSLVTLRNFTSLLDLNLSKNHIGATGSRLLLETLPFMRDLRKLDLSHNDIEHEGLACLVAGFSWISGLESLSLGSNSLGCDAAEELAAHLHKLSRLTELDLSDNELTSDCCDSFARGVTSLRELRALGLRGNKIESEGASKLSACFSGLTGLTSLDLGGNSITASWEHKSVGRFSLLVGLQMLSLGQNHLREHLIRPLFHSLSSLSSLRSLNLSSNGISSSAVKLVLDLVCAATSIKSLNIGGNSMTEGCDGEEIARSLAGLRSLTVLDVSFLSQWSSQARPICAAIMELSNLTDLNVSSNCLSGWEAAGSMRLTNLTSLRCSQVNLTCSNIDRVLVSIGAMRLLRDLDVSRNALQPSGASLLAESLAHLVTLTRLDVSANSIRDEGAVALCHGLTCASRLDRLTLDDNEIARAGALELVSSAHLWPRLRCLSLRGNEICSPVLQTVASSFPEYVKIIE